MTYEEGILEIPKQFEYQPVIVNADKILPFRRVIVLGMGGSRLGADLLKTMRPEMDIQIHSDFGLPASPIESLKESLIVANSYSGNTAEVISGLKLALEQNLNIAIVATGGELANLAVEHGLPHILTPHSEMPPRMMLGHSLLALNAITGGPSELGNLGTVDMESLKELGHNLAKEINTKVPLVYVPSEFMSVGYIWKVIFNETAQVPAFYNRFPEIFHNEVAGFQNPESSSLFHAVILKELGENQKLQSFISILRQKGMGVTELEIVGESKIQKVFSSILISHWTALKLSEESGVNPILPEVIEKLKSN